MARFPRAEADIAALAGTLIDGLLASSSDFPSPPIDVAKMQASLDAYRNARHGAAAAAVAAQDATRVKNGALKQLVREMKSNLRYAENAAQFDDARLARIGWGPRRPQKTLEPPGQVMNLEIVREGAGWIALEWEAPVDGGKVGAYEVRRGNPTDETGQIVATALDAAVFLTHQERTVEWRYWVIARNRAGVGKESNIVQAVL